MRGVIRYHHGKVIRYHAITSEDLWVQNGKIIPPQEKANHEIDLKGLIVAAGYIDLQMNGAFGKDFTTEPGSAKKVAQNLGQFGVTSFLPTIISTENYKKVVPDVKVGTTAGAEILGIHLEGPFLSKKYAGAHSVDLFRNCEEGFYGSLDGVKMVTLAPELPTALDLIKSLSKKGIVVAAGHTEATLQQIELAVDAGLKMVTHLFNAMAPLHHREPGVIAAVLSATRHLYFSVIADGVHLHPATVKLAWNANPSKLVLVSDATAALGAPPGSYSLGKRQVHSDGKSITLEGAKTLAGSILGLDQTVRNFKEFTGCSIVQAIEAASLYPAQVLGITERKGHLNIGADADFIFLDDDLNVKATFVAGSKIFG